MIPVQGYTARGDRSSARLWGKSARRASRSRHVRGLRGTTHRDGGRGARSWGKHNGEYCTRRRRFERETATPSALRGGRRARRAAWRRPSSPSHLRRRPKPRARAARTSIPIVCENQKPGTDPDVWDIDRAPATPPSRGSPPTSASTPARRSTSRSTRTPRRTRSTSTGPAGTRAWARARSPRSHPSATLPQNQPRVHLGRHHRAVRLRHLGRLRILERARPTPSPVCTSRKLTRNDNGGREPHHLHRPQ